MSTIILKSAYDVLDGGYVFYPKDIAGGKIVIPAASIILVDDEADERYIALKSTTSRKTLYLLEK